MSRRSRRIKKRLLNKKRLKLYAALTGGPWPDLKPHKQVVANWSDGWDYPNRQEIESRTRLKEFNRERS